MFDKISNYKNNDYRSVNYSGNWSNHFINQYFENLDNIGYDETNIKMSQFKNEHLPNSLYKFYPPTTFSLLSLENQTLYLSNPRNFNDPFDSYLCSERESYGKIALLKSLKNKNLINEIGSEDSLSYKEYFNLLNSFSKEGSKPYNKNHFYTELINIKRKKSNTFSDEINNLLYEEYKTYDRKIEELNSREMGISCFSSFKDEESLFNNTTLWSHYADHHRGFCVEYSLEFEGIKNSNEILCGLFPVNYTSRVPKLSTANLIKLTIDQEYIKINKALMKSIYKSYITKSSFWSYEKEWRIILDLNTAHFCIERTIPFLKAKKIFLGCRIDYNLKKHIANFAFKNNIEICSTKQSRENFKLFYYEIDTNDVIEEDDRKMFKNIQRIKDPDLRFKKLGDYFE